MSLDPSYYETPASGQPPNGTTIPIELQDTRQWVASGTNKMPVNARTGAAASSTDPQTWSGFDAVARLPLAGFVFTPDDPYFVIDLDKVRNAETGEIEPWAMEIVERFGTYAEVSMSGRGLHLIGRGVLPKAGNRKGRIEVYDAERYVALTGNVLPGYERIRNCQRTLTDWHHEVWSVEQPKPAAAPSPRPAPIIHLEDRDLEDRLRRQKDGGKAARLLDGDAGDYNSPSEARSALGAYACFWNAAVDQVERLIRYSGLWKDGETDAERDRKARIDAEHVVAWYEQQGGKRYSGPPPAADYENVDTDTGEILDTATDAGPATDERIERLQRRVEQLTRDRDQLVTLILNTTMTPAHKIVLVRMWQLAMRKPAGEDGRVALKPAEIAHDWRPKPEKGENTVPTNADGSVPLMNRGSVAGHLKALGGETALPCKKTAKLLEVEGVTQKVKPKNGGQPWSETVWLIPRPTSLGEFIAPAAEFTSEPKRKLRTITPPCPECGEVHPRTVQTETHYTCHGCGESWSEEGRARVEWPIVQIGPDMTGPMPVEEYEYVPPERTAAQCPDSEPDPSESHTPRRCIDCGVHLAPIERHLCADCFETFAERNRRQHVEHRKRRGICIDGDCPEPAVAGSFYCAGHGGTAEVSA